jgi:uncharacterized coiled-coil DUF342 family protein
MSNECPNPSRPCPVDTKDLVHRLESIERHLSEAREKRQDSNAQIKRVIDEGRVERMEMQTEISELKEMHKDVLELLKGSWGREGMVGEHENLLKEVKDIQGRLSSQKAFIAGMGAAFGVLGGLISALVMHIFKG